MRVVVRRRGALRGVWLRRERRLDQARIRYRARTIRVSAQD
jgi:hypothetical protein